ncbi:MAG TPA: sulfotransferase [Gaiellaceae bacterium]
MNPYVFIVGCPRSGTTLLSRIGDAHPELAIIRELHWLPRWWERRVGLTNEGFVTRELIAKIRSHERFPRLELEPSALDRLLGDDRPKHYTRFVADLFSLHGDVKGKRLVGEKTPHYVRALPTLHALWPHAKFVHLIRDGRDVALSLLDWSRSDRAAGRFPSWDEDAVTTAALFWDCHVRLGREAAGLLGSERYHELRYESLVVDPKRECQRLCDFLGVRFDQAMLSFHKGHVRSKKSGPRRPVTPGLRRWREQMESEDVARFEAAAGHLLTDLGYPTGAPPASAEALDRAGRFRTAFAEYAHSRRLPVPQAWNQIAA